MSVTIKLGRRSRSIVKGLGRYSLLILIIVAVDFPLFWMVSSSLKSEVDIMRRPPVLIPEHPVLDNFIKLLTTTNFGRYFINSLIVSASTVAICIGAAVLAAYALVRFRISWGETFAKSVLFAYLFPPILLLFPIFTIVTRLNLANNYLGLSLSYTVFLLPLSIWMLRSYFSDLPKEIWEAGLVDGAGELTQLFRIFMPIAIPGIMSTTMITFILSWNEYMYALTLMTDEAMKTLSVGAMGFMERTAVDWGLMMAGGVVISVPVVILFVYLHKYLVSGLSAGAVKG